VEEILALAALNRFGSSSPKADIVPPSEESVFILTSGQLQDLIKEAIQPLQDRIGSLEATVAAQNEKIASLEATQEQDTNRICVDIAHDRQRISRLEHPTKEPGKTEISRAERIEKYLASRPDHKASFETLKGHLQVDNVRLNEAIKILMATSNHSYSILKAKAGDKRKRVLVMLPR
jgi:hypothetical protein